MLLSTKTRFGNAVLSVASAAIVLLAFSSPLLAHPGPEDAEASEWAGSMQAAEGPEEGVEVDGRGFPPRDGPERAHGGGQDPRTGPPPREGGEHERDGRAEPRAREAAEAELGDLAGIRGQQGQERRCGGRQAEGPHDRRRMPVRREEREAKAERKHDAQPRRRFVQPIRRK